MPDVTYIHRYSADLFWLLTLARALEEDRLRVAFVITTPTERQFFEFPRYVPPHERAQLVAEATVATYQERPWWQRPVKLFVECHEWIEALGARNALREVQLALLDEAPDAIRPDQTQPTFERHCRRTQRRKLFAMG